MTPQRSPIITVAELAEYLHIHQSTVYRMLKRRELPAFRIGSDWRFNREEIDAWMRAQSNSSAPGSSRPRSSA